MLKKLLFMIICCLMLTACGGEETKNDVNELKPLYSGFFFGVFDVNIEDYKVPDGFITRKMSSDIKKVMKEHQSKDNSEDGSIDKETAVDIAIAIMKCGQESYFEKPTFYCISYRLDVDAYFVEIGQENGINVVGGLSTKLVISKKDGTLLAIWTS